MTTNTVFVVDARNRDRMVFTASATVLAHDPGAIVLRKGVTVGTLDKVLVGRVMQHPLLIIGDYQAQSSAGHVTPLGGDNFWSGMLVGGSGFGREVDGKRKGDALRPFTRLDRVIFIPAGTKVTKVETHHRGSNCATTKAVLEGLKIMAECDPNLFLLVEGQSDYTSAVSFKSPLGVDKDNVEFPTEHQTETFGPKSLFRTYLRRHEHVSDRENSDPVARDGRMFLLLSEWRVSPSITTGLTEDQVDLISPFMERVTELLGDFERAGWSSQIEEYDLVAISPSGEKVAKRWIHTEGVTELLSVGK